MMIGTETGFAPDVPPIELIFETNTFRMVIDYLNNLGMDAQYEEGKLLYTDGNKTYTVLGREGEGGTISISGEVSRETLLDLVHITGDSRAQGRLTPGELRHRRKTLREIMEPVEEDRQSAMNVLKSQANQHVEKLTNINGATN